MINLNWHSLCGSSMEFLFLIVNTCYFNCKKLLAYQISLYYKDWKFFYNWELFTFNLSMKTTCLQVVNLSLLAFHVFRLSLWSKTRTEEPIPTHVNYMFQKLLDVVLYHYRQFFLKHLLKAILKFKWSTTQTLKKACGFMLEQL